MPLTAADIAHAIDHLLRSPCLKPTDRKRVLDYVASGYNEYGHRIDRSEELEQQMKTLECDECTEVECRADCPVRPFRDVLTRGDCAAVMVE